MDGWMMMIDKKHIDQTLLFKKVDKDFVHQHRFPKHYYSWIPATGFFPFTRPYAIRYVDGLAIGFLRGCMLPATPLW
jgi:hypothetical protein